MISWRFLAFIGLLTISCGAEDNNQMDISKQYFIDRNLETGIKLESVGSLNLVGKTETILFVLDLKSTIDNATELFREKLKSIKEYCINSNHTCTGEIQELEISLENRLNELNDFMKSDSSPSRKRRSLDLEDGQKIAADIGMLHDIAKQTKENLVSQYGEMKTLIKAMQENVVYMKESNDHQNNLTRELVLLGLTSSAQFEMIKFGETIKSFYRVFVNKRMDSDLITIKEFQLQLDEIEARNKDTEYVLPFKRIREYYNLIETRTSKDTSGNLVVEMDIPLVKKKQSTLQKIIKIPTQRGEKLLSLNTQWSYASFDGEYVTYFLSLETCMKTIGFKNSDPVYICQLQSPMYNISNGDCLTKSFNEQKIDLEQCRKEDMIRYFKSDQLTFIKESEGFYFYFTSKNENIQIICRGNITEEVLEKPMGTLSLEPGCSGVTDRVKLIALGRGEGTPFWKKNIITFAYNAKDIDATIAKLHVDAVKVPEMFSSIEKFNSYFSEGPNPKDIDIPAELSFKADMGMWSMIGLVAIVVIFIFVGFLYCKFSRKPEPKKLDDEKY